MATKDELVAFANAHGVDVDATWLKADIEAALTDAGYDPATLEATDMTDETTPPEDLEAQAEYILSTSSDSQFSTYSEVAPDAAIQPAPGRIGEETRGEPTESAEPK